MPSTLVSHRAVVEAACLTPWGDEASGLPGAAASELPLVPGFAISRFGPLVHAVASACLGPVSAPGIPVVRGDTETAIVLATMFGDTTTVDTANRSVASGRPPNPILFFQSVTTSILSLLTRHYDIKGPLVCISAVPDPAGEALWVADALLDDRELQQVLVICAEIEPNERVRRAVELAAPDGWNVPLPAGDAAAALLLRRVETGTEGARLTLAKPTGTTTRHTGGPDRPLGWLGGLMELCADVVSGWPGPYTYELSR